MEKITGISEEFYHDRALNERYEAILKRVQKPGRYIGGEVNSIRKDWGTTPLKIALVFPDSYEIAMSYMGQLILYDILNAMPDVLAERVYTPWPDMEQALREGGVPILSLESRRPLTDFDVIAVSMPYELTYTNFLIILDLAHIPFYSRDRELGAYPFILSGGTASYNPEPYAEFMDAIVVGDGEDVIVALANDFLARKRGELSHQSVPCLTDLREDERVRLSTSKSAFLHHLTRHDGVYVPHFFRPEYRESGVLDCVRPLVSGYTGVKKAIVADLDRAPYPSRMLVPTVGVVHDRIGIEVQRGCTRACRFCQAGYIERPTRQRSPERVSAIAKEAYASTGKDEISLLSLSVGDYSCVSPLLNHLNETFQGKSMSLSLPATRTETLTPEMIQAIKKVRQTGFTIAPEAGTERMRRVINKGNEEQDLFTTAQNVFQEGWRLIKLYYLMGLPTETDVDLAGIVREAEIVRDIGRKAGVTPTINVSVSSFVPKPFTPFQWHGQDSLDENNRKQKFFKTEFGARKGLKFKYHDSGMSLIEGIFSRGDRRLSALLVAAHRLGCRMDEWAEWFSLAKWRTAISETGVDLDFYVHRARAFDECLPWDHLFTQMKKDFLVREYQGALEEAYVADCSRHKCEDCGVCDFRAIKNRVYLPSHDDVVFKKGNRLGKGSALGLLVKEGESINPPVSPFFKGGKNKNSGLNVATSLQASEDFLSSQAASLQVSKDFPSLKKGEDFPPLKKGDTGGFIEKSTVPKTAHRIRFRFYKKGPAAFIGHLDMMNHFRRAIRRVDTPIIYTAGFHPQMRSAFGPALGLGKESDHEYVDLFLSEAIDIPLWIEEVNQALPLGLRVIEGFSVSIYDPSIQVLKEQGLLQGVA